MGVEETGGDRRKLEGIGGNWRGSEETGGDWRKLGTVLRMKNVFGVEWAPFIRKSEVCIHRVHHSPQQDLELFACCMGVEDQALSALRSTFHRVDRPRACAITEKRPDTIGFVSHLGRHCLKSCACT